MSLSPKLRDIFGSYEFCDEERRQLITLLEESNKQYEKELKAEPEYADWKKSSDLYGKLSGDANDFFNELCEYTIAWKYSTQDIVDANNEILKELKGERE